MSSQDSQLISDRNLLLANAELSYAELKRIKKRSNVMGGNGEEIIVKKVSGITPLRSYFQEMLLDENFRLEYEATVINGLWKAAYQEIDVDYDVKHLHDDPGSYAIKHNLLIKHDSVPGDYFNFMLSKIGVTTRFIRFGRPERVIVIATPGSGMTPVPTYRQLIDLFLKINPYIIINLLQDSRFIGICLREPELAKKVMCKVVDIFDHYARDLDHKIEAFLRIFIKNLRCKFGICKRGLFIPLLALKYGFRIKINISAQYNRWANTTNEQFDAAGLLTECISSPLMIHKAFNFVANENREEVNALKTLETKTKESEGYQEEKYESRIEEPYLSCLFLIQPSPLINRDTAYTTMKMHGKLILKQNRKARIDHERHRIKKRNRMARAERERRKATFFGSK